MVEVRNITDFNDYLESLLIQNESDDLEFKSAAGGFPGSFWDTYSAFANTDGGTIVLGVQEKKGRFFLDNLSEEQIEKYRKDFWNNVNNTSTISRNLMQKEDVVIGNYMNVATSEANVATSEANVATSKTANVATSETANVATSIKKRMSREELQSLIMSVCNEWISLEELSARIERDSTYLRNHVIPLMLASKKLQMLFPGTPNHPNQQYKVTD